MKIYIFCLLISQTEELNVILHIFGALGKPLEFVAGWASIPFHSVFFFSFKAFFNYYHDPDQLAKVDRDRPLNCNVAKCESDLLEGRDGIAPKIRAPAMQTISLSVPSISPSCLES